MRAGGCAIRPPEDRFSWDYRRDVRLDGGNLATVAEERRRGPGRQPHERQPRGDPSPPPQG